MTETEKQACLKMAPWANGKAQGDWLLVPIDAAGKADVSILSCGYEGCLEEETATMVRVVWLTQQEIDGLSEWEGW